MTDAPNELNNPDSIHVALDKANARALDHTLVRDARKGYLASVAAYDFEVDELADELADEHEEG